MTKSAFLQELRGAETPAKNLSSTRLCTCPFTSRLWLWILASCALYVPGTLVASNEKTKLSPFHNQNQFFHAQSPVSPMPRSLITREGPPKSLPRVWISEALSPNLFSFGHPRAPLESQWLTSMSLSPFLQDRFVVNDDSVFQPAFSTVPKLAFGSSTLRSNLSFLKESPSEVSPTPFTSVSK